MAGIRFQLDLFIPEGVFTSIPDAKKAAFRAAVKALKTYAISVGQEMTVKATWHKCYHDETPTKPCELEKEI